MKARHLVRSDLRMDESSNARSFAVPAAPMRLALLAVQIGAIAVVLLASPRTVFDLDRFLVPKELALHLTAVMAGLLTLPAIRRSIAGRLDLLLAGYLLLSGFSAMLAANRWLALRALAISASGVALFWAARALRDAGLERPLLGGLAVAIVIAAVTSLLQAYGLRTAIFALNRAPSVPPGNRNFVAHVAAFGLPLCLLAALRARRAAGYRIASIGVAIVTASLVLSRSRAAWLASAVALLVFFAISVRSQGRRLLGTVIFAAGGIAAALLLPNALRWRSDNPYLESVTGVVNYEQGSGRGRLVQYGQSLRLAVKHPLLGAGPGNWPVEYPKHVARNDPSLNESEPGMTFNPWPSSDWVAFVAERGFAAAALMALVFAGLAAGAFRRLREDELLAATLLSTTAAVAIVGLFDAVLLLAAPALIVWAALGALWIPSPPGRPVRALIVLAVIAIAAMGAARSGAQLVAMEIYATRSDRASLERGARIDPGSYRLHLRLARGGKERCRHALAALSLFPTSSAAREVSRGCAAPRR